MHSKIIQISEKPISKRSFVSESQYYDDFVGRIADYVDELREDYRCDCVKSCLGGDAFVVAEDGKSFEVVDKDSYFRPRYDQFMKTLNDLKDATLEDFAGSSLRPHYEFSYKVSLMASSYEDDYDIYVDDNGEKYGLIPLDQFMRYAQNGEKYYVGNVIDYHF